MATLEIYSRPKNNRANNKTRIFCLDFIRVVACLMILIFHYNCMIETDFLNPSSKVLFFLIGSVNTGTLGIYLFFILSGGSLYLAHKDKFSIKKYYKKRFLSIYPLFWILFVAFTLIDIFVKKQQIPSYDYRLIYSIIGIDGLLEVYGITTFYKLGTWFLGAIIIFYLIFPLILFLFKKRPKLVFLISIILSIVAISIHSNNSATNPILFVQGMLIVELPLMIFGMYIVNFLSKINFKVFAISSILLILISVCCKEMNYHVQASIISPLFFIILVYCSKIFNKKYHIYLKKISLLTYPAFLLHPWILNTIVTTFNLSKINKATSYLCFIAFALVIFILSFICKKMIDLLSIAIKKCSSLLKRKTCQETAVK